MFIDTVSQGITNRGVQERFQHFGETVSRYFYQIMNTLVEMYVHYVQLPDKNYYTDRRITSNPKYASYFEDCLGIFDGTYIDARTLSQNVLAVVMFDLQYCYVLPG